MEDEEQAPETPPVTDETKAEESLDATAVGQEPTEDGFVMSEHDHKLAEANERYLRLLADFDNYRKRAQKDRMELRAVANEDMLAEVLPVLDNLERAITAARDGKGGPEGFEGVLKGVELTQKMFMGILARYGVERIKVIGKPFDPNRHEAVSQVETDDLEADTIAQELLPGYTMNGRVIRASRVTVTKPKTEAPAEADAEQEDQEEESSGN